MRVLRRAHAYAEQAERRCAATAVRQTLLSALCVSTAFEATTLPLIAALQGEAVRLQGRLAQAELKLQVDAANMDCPSNTMAPITSEGGAKHALSSSRPPNGPTHCGPWLQSPKADSSASTRRRGRRSR